MIDISNAETFALARRRVKRMGYGAMQLAGPGSIAYVPFFPLGGFTPLQSTALSDVAKTLGVTPMQVALAWLLQRAPNILLIPGTSSVAHLRENLAAAHLKLPDAALTVLNQIGPAAAGK
jgi:pyridoxine 4-dehydrogenase